MNWRFLPVLAGIGLGTGFWIGFYPPVSGGLKPTNSASPSLKATKTLLQPTLLGRSEQVSTEPQREEENEALPDRIAKWNANNAEAAYERWAHSPEAREGNLEPEILHALRQQWGFQRTLEFLLSVAQDDEAVQTEALTSLASQVSEEKDPEGVIMELCERIPEELRTDVIAIAIRSWAHGAEFANISKWIDDHIETFAPKEIATLERAATEKLLEKNPDVAAGWLMERATETSRGDHLTYIVDRWAEYTPNAAAEWLSTLPPSPDTDRAIESFSGLIALDDPESAAHWAASIIDENIRARALESVIREWRRLDPEQAAQFQAVLEKER